MTEERAREVMLRVLGEIAPEAELDGLESDVPFQEQLDLDSMDFLSFVIGLHEETGVEIPERDYPRVATPATCVAYLVTASGR